MSPRAPWKAWLLTLICVVLLWTRVGGAHLHLCFDGQEPASTLHLTHAGPEHAEPGLSAPHHDLWFALGTEAMAKPPAFDTDLPPVLLLALCALWLASSRPRVPVAGRAGPQVPRVPHRLRPPLRGPPLTTRA